MKIRCIVVRTALVVLCLLFAASNHAAAADPAVPLVLARDGQTRYTIVIARDAVPAETLAAKELALFLKKMTGATFPVRTDDAPITGTEIVLGNTTRRKRDDLPPHLCTDNWEGFSIVREGERLVIVGDIPRATLYGVYDFLDVELGVRFLAHKGNYVPRRPTLEVSVTSRGYGPPIERRTIWEGGLLGDATLRNRMKKLSVLTLVHTSIGNASMKVVRDLTDLKHLELSYTKVTDDGLADVATLADLQHLDIYTTAVTDAGLEHLQKLGRLNYLNLYDVTSVTDEAVDTLRRAVSGLHVRQY